MMTSAIKISIKKWKSIFDGLFKQMNTTKSSKQSGSKDQTCARGMNLNAYLPWMNEIKLKTSWLFQTMKICRWCNTKAHFFYNEHEFELEAFQTDHRHQWKSEERYMYIFGKEKTGENAYKAAHSTTFNSYSKNDKLFWNTFQINQLFWLLFL